jgi:hypothetical protein
LQLQNKNQEHGKEQQCRSVGWFFGVAGIAELELDRSISILQYEYGNLAIGILDFVCLIDKYNQTMTVSFLLLLVGSVCAMDLSDNFPLRDDQYQALMDVFDAFSEPLIGACCATTDFVARPQIAPSPSACDSTRNQPAHRACSAVLISSAPTESCVACQFVNFRARETFPETLRVSPNDLASIYHSDQM